MSKVYKVLLGYNGCRDVRVRCDTQKRKGFEEFTIDGVDQKFIKHTEYVQGTYNVRIFTVVFETTDPREAKKFADGLKMVYDARSVKRTILCQE